MEAGSRRPLLPPRKAQPRGDAGESGGAAYMGEKARHGSGIAGGRICRPVRHSPKGTQESGRAARRAWEGRRAAMEAGSRRPLLPPRKAQPRGDAGESGGAAYMGEKARHGSGIAEAAPAAL